MLFMTGHPGKGTNCCRIEGLAPIQYFPGDIILSQFEVFFPTGEFLNFEKIKGKTLAIFLDLRT